MAHYGYSFDELELFYGDYPTEEDAFESAVFDAEASGGRTEFFISYFNDVVPKWNTTAEDIVAEMEAYIAGSNHLDCVAELAEEDEIRELDRALNEVISNWAKKYHIGSEYSLISWTKRYVLDETEHTFIQDIDYST